MPDTWEMDANHPTDYHVVETKRGREFIIRLTTGADVFKAIQQFAKDNNIRFAKIHTMFMGGLQPPNSWCGPRTAKIPATGTTRRK